MRPHRQQRPEGTDKTTSPPSYLQDRYRLVERLGEGSMGVVYLARDETLDRDVVIKFLTPARITSGEASAALPAVLDFGMGKCIPCKAMKPILEQLATEYDGRARIEIIDIGERPDEAERWQVFVIPTQIFVDARGNEVYRHEGFMPKEDIVAKLREMGVE